MFLIQELTNESGEKVIIGHIRSACCKTTVFFIEDSPDQFVDALTRERVHPGMRKSILNARQHKHFWTP